jgi:hypothetical protein
MLKMSAAELAERAEVTLRTVQRIESFEGVPPSRAGSLERIQAVLEAEGIAFIGDPLTSPGVQLRHNLEQSKD